MLQILIFRSVVHLEGEIFTIHPITPLIPSLLGHLSVDAQLEKNQTIGINKPLPIVSMYGIFSYIYHKNQPNVGY